MPETFVPAAPSSSSRTPAPTHRAAVVTSAIAVVVSVLEVAAGGLFWYLTATDPSDDPLVGLGYLLAILVGAPGVVGVVLGALGWLLARHVAGLVLGILGVVAAAGPLLVVLLFASPTF